MYQPDENWIMEITAEHGIVDPKDLARNLMPTEKAAIPVSTSWGDPIIHSFLSHVKSVCTAPSRTYCASTRPAIKMLRPKIILVAICLPTGMMA